METHPPPTPSPWLDLPISLTESILERLPFPDYVTFAAVCPKWRSIQQNHRLLRGRHLSIPWLIPFALEQDEEEDPPQETLIPCYSPFEHHRLRRLRLPFSLSNYRFCASSCGWILHVHEKHNGEATNAAADTKKKRHRWTRMSGYSPPLPHLLLFALLNPISGRHIHLPPIHLAFPYVDYIAAMSPPPNPTVLVVMRYQLFLVRPGEPDWTVLPRPEGVYICDATFCGGNFYCTSYDMSLVVVVDPHSGPTVDFIRMDTSEVPSEPPRLFVSLIVPVEYDGELLLVNAFCNLDEGYVITRFQLFKADLSRMKWVRLESLGDQALLMDQDSCVLLRANDFGGRRNCVYFSEAALFLYRFYSQPTEWIPLKVFDLGTERTTEWPLPDTLREYDCSLIKEYSWRWIVPSLENVNAEADGGIASISQHLLPMRL